MEPRKSKGQSLIEFALILPVLLIILVVLADLSRAIAAQISLSNAAREGARYAANYPLDINGIRNRVLLEYNNTGVRITGMELRMQDISVAFPSGGATTGNQVRVTTQARFPLFFGSFFPAGIVDADGTMPLGGSAEMVIF